MSTRPLVDPELVAMLDIFPGFDLAQSDLKAMRVAARDALPSSDTYWRDGIERIDLRVPGSVDISAILYRPVGVTEPLPILLNIHGGGYILGCAQDTAPFDVAMAAELQCAVVAVEYRLAPEHPYPAGLEDCFAVLQWLWQEADSLGLDRRRFAVGGQSAGGGLAAALALKARDEGSAKLCFQMLVYPMLDDRRAASAEPDGLTGEFIWTRESNAIGWASYLGMEAGCAGVSPLAAPARAQDLAGLPPAWICVGQLDLFLEEDLDYARRLMFSGVPTELHVLPGAYHGFEMVPDARLSRESTAARIAAAGRAFQAAIRSPVEP